MRRGFIFDLNKCVGCEACVVACQIQNHGSQSESWRSISTFNSLQYPALPLFHFSLACNHCDDPSCQIGCPANAFSLDPVHHTVDHDQDLCIGCGYCTWTCPYDAPKYVTAKGTIEKCNLCKERIVGGRKPNCANLCPTGALTFGEIDSREAIDILGFADVGIGPGIKIVPLRKGTPPATSKRPLHTQEGVPFAQMKSPKDRKTTLKSEWPLVVFTLLAALLCALFGATVLGKPILDPTTFIALAIGGMIVSSIHLGKPLKGWRAIINVRSSWLSREIVAYSLFLGVSGLYFLDVQTAISGILGLLAGFATLLSIDLVYASVDRQCFPLAKSGSIFITGVTFFAVLAQLPVLLIIVLGANFIVYSRQLLTTGKKNVRRLFASGVRTGVGFILPLLLTGVQGSSWLIAGFLLIGESINRAEFYLDLDIMTPRGQIERDLLKRLTMPILEQR
jgi:Fe-S-cluster-containing dehydrogenase component